MAGKQLIQSACIQRRGAPAGFLRLRACGRIRSSFENYLACKCFETGTIHLLRVYTVKHDGAFICTDTAVTQQLRKAQRSPGKSRSVREQEKHKLRPLKTRDWFFWSSVNGTGLRLWPSLLWKTLRVKRRTFHFVYKL